MEDEQQQTDNVCLSLHPLVLLHLTLSHTVSNDLSHCVLVRRPYAEPQHIQQVLGWVSLKRPTCLQTTLKTDED